MFLRDEEPFYGITFGYGERSILRDDLILPVVDASLMEGFNFLFEILLSGLSSFKANDFFIMLIILKE